MAAARGLLRSDPGPTGQAASLSEWATAHEAHCGARWLSSPLPPPLPRRAAQTLCEASSRRFDAALLRFETLERAPSSTRDVAVLPGARLVTVDGLVITHDGLLATETAWDDDKLHASGVLRSRRLPRARFAPGLQASLISQWCEAYYHWMTDALPRLAVLEANGFADAALVVPENLTPWQSRSLEMLGAGGHVTRYGGYLQAETLLWPRPASFPGHTPAWVGQWLRERFVGALGSARRREPDGRLYLTRRDDARPVANEDDVWALLEPLGFRMVDAGRLPLEEQVALFADASVVVAPHGGALTNVAFGSSLTVVELFDPEYVNPCFYALADACGHEYWYVVGRSAPGGSFTADILKLGDTLASIGLF